MPQKSLGLSIRFRSVLVAFSRRATVAFKKDQILCSATWFLLYLLGFVHGLSPVQVHTRDGMGNDLLKMNKFTIL